MMTECLLRDAEEDFDVHVDLLNRALRGVSDTLATTGSGRSTHLATDSSTFRTSRLACQVSFDETIDRELAERVVAEIIASLGAVTQKTFHAVWIS